MECPERKSIRLQSYDYSAPGAYFITVCTKEKSKILWENVGAHTMRPTVVHQLKSAITKRAGAAIRQKGFYDHVIRGEKDYQDIRQYIDNDPYRWSEDCYFEE